MAPLAKREAFRRRLANICLSSIIASAAIIAAPGAASAATVVLDFEGINATHPSGYATIGNFYNGGMSSDGTTGTNYGINFSNNALAICLNTLSAFCSNTSRGGLGDPSSQLGGLFFLQGAETFLNYESGFDTGFSFNYVSVSFSGAVSVFDGLNGTGNVLGTIDLSPNAGSCPGYSAGFCPFAPAGVAFTGVAKSISFAGVANQIVFDDVTFGSATPGPDIGAVPEPSTWAMMLVGFGLIGGAMRTRRRQKLAASYA